MSQKVAINADVSDALRSMGSASFSDVTLIDMPATYGAPWDIVDDTSNIPTLITEIPDNDSVDNYVCTLVKASDSSTYTRKPTTDFVGSRPVHHPR